MDHTLSKPVRVSIEIAPGAFRIISRGADDGVNSVLRIIGIRVETIGPHIASVIIGGGIMSLAFRKRPRPFFADGLDAFVPSLWLRADLEKRYAASHLVEGDASPQNGYCAVTESCRGGTC